ncbi:recombinase family protein [Streptomyces sp. SP17KL33]|uniref:recombinase family protein n=1 Tax=Streptomyces sp. SP17KL33 TaxID=3002534 RepID=UPI002E78A3D3|nr:recombinase family protein [Streptomyces sp. SP17KL33]MEE1834907.1 recombinase family protein [Streptomyces sp. SP17KL33]
MNRTKPVRAVLLVRISDDKSEEAKGVGRQEDDGRALAARIDWGIAEVVVENDVSAFKRRKIKLPDGTTALRTVRPAFRAAMDKLMSGERDGLLAYDLDRVARDPRDLEDLIDVVESRDPLIPVESVTGSLRLANDADITMARVMVAVANKASRDTRRRVTRTHEQLAAEGKRNGGGFRGYGFDRRGLEVILEEATVIWMIAEWILDGRSLNAVATELNRREVPTVTGAKWNSRSVRSVVTKPSVAGLRSYKGQIVRGADGEPIKAAWPPILDRDTWEQVCGVLAGRAGTSDLTLKRWLTRVLHCPSCGHLLTGWQGNNGKPKYWCASPLGGCGKITVQAAEAEAEVERQVLGLLTKPRVLERLHVLSTSEVTDDARSELAEDEAQLKELARMWARREMSLGEYREARKIIEQRVTESRALINASAPRVLRTLLAGDVREGWGKLTPADKREVVLTLAPDGYDVMPHDRSRGNKFQPERLRLVA